MLKQRRQIVPFESFYLWRTKLNIYTNFRVAAEYSRELSVETIYYALAEMIKKFPQLSLSAYPTDNSEDNYELKFIPKYKLNDVMEVVDNINLSIGELFDSIEHVSFEYSQGPLWKIILLNKSTLIFYCEHLLFDGTSGMNFHKEFYNALNNLHKGTAFVGMDSILFDFSNVSSTIEIGPLPTDVVDYSASFSTAIYTLTTELFPKFISNWVRVNFSRNKYTPLLTKTVLVPSVEGWEGKNKVKIFSLPKDSVSRLISFCRSHGVKLTSLLAVICLTAIKPITGNKDTRTTIPNDARSLMNLEELKDVHFNFHPQFGLFLGFLDLDLPATSKIQVDDKFDWELVKYVHERIHENIPHSLETFGLLKYVNAKKYFTGQKENIENGHFSTLIVSNLGNIECTEGETTIKNAWFDQNFNSTACFLVDVIGSESGINICLRTHNQEWMDVLFEGIQKITKELLNE